MGVVTPPPGTQWYQETLGMLPSWLVSCGWFMVFTILMLSPVKMATKSHCRLHLDEVTRQDGNKPQRYFVFPMGSALW